MRVRSWAWALLLVAVGVLVLVQALNAARRNAHIWSAVRAFTAAFGGIIGVTLLLALVVALLFLCDMLLFRQEPGTTRDRDGA